MSVEELRHGAPEPGFRAYPERPIALDTPDPTAEPSPRRRPALVAAALVASALFGALVHAGLPREPSLDLAIGPGALTPGLGNVSASVVVENRGSEPVRLVQVQGGSTGLSVTGVLDGVAPLAAGASERIALRLEVGCGALDRGAPASVRVTATTAGGGQEETRLPVGGPGATWEQAFVGLCESVSRYVLGADYLGPFRTPSPDAGTTRPRFTWLMQLRLLSRHTEDVSVTVLRMPSRGARVGTEPDLPRVLGEGSLDLLVRAALPGCEQWRADGTDNGLEVLLTSSTGGRATVFVSLGADFERDFSAAMAASCPRVAPAEIALRHI